MEKQASFLHAAFAGRESFQGPAMALLGKQPATPLNEKMACSATCHQMHLILSSATNIELSFRSVNWDF